LVFVLDELAEEAGGDGGELIGGGAEADGGVAADDGGGGLVEVEELGVGDGVIGALDAEGACGGGVELSGDGEEAVGLFALGEVALREELLEAGVAEGLVDVGRGELGEDAAHLVELGVDSVVELEDARDELFGALLGDIVHEESTEVAHRSVQGTGPLLCRRS
jgi:hypothetical protein